MENRFKYDSWPAPKIYIYSRGLPFKIFCVDKGGLLRQWGRYDRKFWGDLCDNVGLYL